MKPRVLRRNPGLASWAIRVGFAMVNAFACGLGFASHGHALEREATDSRVVVLVRDSAAGSLESTFADALRTHLRSLGLTLDVQPAPASTNPFDIVANLRGQSRTSDEVFVAWIAQQKPRIIVYIFDPRGPRLRARAVTVSGSTAAASEELALILRSAIMAQREGGSLEMADVALPAESRSDRVKPSVPAPPPAIPSHAEASSTSKPKPPTFGLFAGFAYSHIVENAKRSGALELGLWVQGRGVRTGLSYLLQPPVELPTELAEVSIHRHPITAHLGRALYSADVSLLGELRLTADPMRRVTDFATVPLESRASEWRWGWSVGGLLRAEAQLLPGWLLSGAVGVEFALNPFDFEVFVAGRRHEVGGILPVRPIAGLDLVWVAR